jgi:hypothetical protein
MKLRIIFTTAAQRKPTGRLIVGQFANLINTGFPEESVQTFRGASFALHT